MAEEEVKKHDLFDYTEDQLLHENVLTHYEVLSLSPYCSNDQVKKAYRKASLKYHPDKTGRGDDDYVFLAVKHAYDTLYDDDKRQAYDSTVLPFDDSIPPPRAQMMADPMLLYKDEDFYQTFGPVFNRNLRFDAKLRPDAQKNKKKNNNKKGKNGNSAQHGKHHPPSLGDENTPMEEVHAFYEYWIHFESWRDFSAQAADDLQVENELENAESRFEKRWIQREIDKRAKQLKTKENGRIQSLVERAMEADPRLRRERQAALEAKEQAKKDREMAKERAKVEAQEAAVRAERQAAADQERAAAAKVEREQQKKQIRKARQALRKQTSSFYEEATIIWDDAYDMGLDVDVLCQNLELHELRQFNEQVQALEAAAALQLVHARAVQERESPSSSSDKNNNNNNQTASAASSATAETTTSTATNASNGSSAATATAATTASPSTDSKKKSNTPLPWTKDELSILAKGVKKFPAGGANRWDQIALYVNNVCQQDEPRTREECIAKYNEVARPSSNNNNKTTAPAPTAVSSSPSASKKNGVSASSATTNGTANNTSAQQPAESESAAKPNNSTPAEAAAASATSAADEWTSDQDQLLQQALATFPASMDKNERWSSIAAAVPGKTKKDCVQRFKAIREALKKN